MKVIKKMKKRHVLLSTATVYMCLLCLLLCGCSKKQETVMDNQYDNQVTMNAMEDKVENTDEKESDNENKDSTEIENITGSIDSDEAKDILGLNSTSNIENTNNLEYKRVTATIGWFSIEIPTKWSYEFLGDIFGGGSEELLPYREETASGIKILIDDTEYDITIFGCSYTYIDGMVSKDKYVFSTDSNLEGRYEVIYDQNVVYYYVAYDKGFHLLTVRSDEKVLEKYDYEISKIIKSIELLEKQ